jgi:hypothetical protein
VDSAGSPSSAGSYSRATMSLKRMKRDIDDDGQAEQWRKDPSQSST